MLLYSEDDEDDEDEEEEEDSAAGGIFGLRKAAVGGDEDHSEEVRFEIRLAAAFSFKEDISHLRIVI